ncbi:MAG TPA: hypothetical protein PKC06_17555, partial [Saprospiraceae bacterium]|nr:hypothetical protein [Saprospiraceae bacterium]
YYPFGMAMPGKGFNSEKYRFSINGQEKTPEIIEGSTTALYWEYDSRIGRRWNVDPVIKVWISPYLCFRGNPIFYLDPNGDDDFFDLKGKYLGSIGTTHDIRVIKNSKITMDEAAKNLGKHTKLITEFSYFPKEQNNRAMLVSIMNFYARDLKIKKVNIWDAEKNSSTAFAYLAEDYKEYKKGYYVFVGKNGKINESVGQRFNVFSGLRHELEHEIDPNTRKNNIGHVDAIIADINSSYFKRTTWKYKEGAILYAARLLNNALFEDPQNLNQVKEKIKEFNSNKNILEVGQLFYDEKLKTVGTNVNGEPVVVTSKQSKKKSK